jgi:carbonic anhydrase
MTARFDDVLTANERFAASYEKGRLKGTAARGLAVVTCMDSRIDPLALLGLEKGDAKFLRNAGARVTDDVLRTLVLAVHLLEVDRVMIMAHTDCRMTKASEQDIHDEMRKRAGLDTRSLDFGAIEDQRLVLTNDVQRIRSSPYLPKSVAAIGCLYDLDTGRLDILVP